MLSFIIRSQAAADAIIHETKRRDEPLPLRSRIYLRAWWQSVGDWGWKRKARSRRTVPDLGLPCHGRFGCAGSHGLEDDVERSRSSPSTTSASSWRPGATVAPMLAAGATAILLPMCGGEPGRWREAEERGGEERVRRWRGFFSGAARLDRKSTRLNSSHAD